VDKLEQCIRLRQIGNSNCRRSGVIIVAHQAHIVGEEEKLFPYIASRIPRLEMLLYHFRTEHAEFGALIAKLKLLLAGISHIRRADWPAPKRSRLARADYLICL